MDTPSVVQDGPLFHPELLPCLHRIINELDPRSFARFVRTCKDLNQFCFNNRSINIQFWKEKIDFETLQVEEYPTRRYQLSVRKDERDPRKTPFTLGLELWIAIPGGAYKSKHYKGVGRLQTFVKNVARMPFVFELYNVNIDEEADEQHLQEIRQYLTQTFPRLKILGITFTRVENWNSVAQFIQDYKPDKVEFSNLYQTLMPADDDILKSTMNIVKSFRYELDVPDDVICSASLKKLFLPNAKISIATFKELVKKFVNGKLGIWNIGRIPSPIEGPNPYVDAVAEVAETRNVVEIKKSEMEPVLLYYTPSMPNVFYMLKDDGNIGRFAIWESDIHFDYVSSYNY